jgi:ABC-type transport system involved in cytochrome c biogenesis permease subunit
MLDSCEFLKAFVTRWAYVSMMLLISSRLIFTFTDVSEGWKNAIAVFLVIFLIFVLLRTVGILFLRKFRGNDHIIVTRGILESLESLDRTSICESLVDYQILHRNRVMQIGQDFAMNSKASQVYTSIDKMNNTTSKGTSPTQRRVPSRVRVVSIPFSNLDPDTAPRRSGTNS